MVKGRPPQAAPMQPESRARWSESPFPVTWCQCCFVPSRKSRFLTAKYIVTVLRVSFIVTRTEIKRLASIDWPVVGVVEPSCIPVNLSWGVRPMSPEWPSRKLHFHELTSSMSWGIDTGWLAGHPLPTLEPVKVWGPAMGYATCDL